MVYALSRPRLCSSFRSTAVPASTDAEEPGGLQPHRQGIVDHQCIERTDLVRSIPFQMAHIKDKAACVRGEGTDENNFLALSPTMHKLFDGGGYRDGRPIGPPPMVFISVRDCGYACGSESRFPVLLSVQCVNPGTFDLVRSLMEGHIKRECTRCLTFFCDVRVTRFENFQRYVRWKFKRTMRATFGPSWIDPSCPHIGPVRGR